MGQSRQSQDIWQITPALLLILCRLLNKLPCVRAVCHLSNDQGKLIRVVVSWYFDRSLFHAVLGKSK